MLRVAGYENADALTREVVKLYGLRGSLVHEGQTELGDGVARLDAILREVLKSNMRMAATA
jgi:hypothetical protein